MVYSEDHSLMYLGNIKVSKHRAKLEAAYSWLQLIIVQSKSCLNFILFFKLKLFSYENRLENYRVDIQTTVHLWNDLLKLCKNMIKTDTSKFIVFLVEFVFR
jgi:hypothetical protein